MRRRERTGRSAHLGSPAAQHRQASAGHYREATNIAREIVHASVHGDCGQAVDGFERFGVAMGRAYAERRGAGERGHADEAATVWGVHDKSVAAFRKHCPFKYER